LAKVKNYRLIFAGAGLTVMAGSLSKIWGDIAIRDIIICGGLLLGLVIIEVHLHRSRRMLGDISDAGEREGDAPKSDNIADSFSTRFAPDRFRLAVAELFRFAIVGVLGAFILCIAIYAKGPSYVEDASVDKLTDRYNQKLQPTNSLFLTNGAGGQFVVPSLRLGLAVSTNALYLNEAHSVLSGVRDSVATWSRAIAGLFAFISVVLGFLLISFDAAQLQWARIAAQNGTQNANNDQGTDSSPFRKG
jgi:hypothetical protein